MLSLSQVIMFGIALFFPPNSYPDSCESWRYLRLPAIQYSLGQAGKSLLGQVLVIHDCRPETCSRHDIGY